jgi:hypothetical protein
MISGAKFVGCPSLPFAGMVPKMASTRPEQARLADCHDNVAKNSETLAVR